MCPVPPLPSPVRAAPPSWHRGWKRHTSELWPTAAARSRLCRLTLEPHACSNHRNHDHQVRQQKRQDWARARQTERENISLTNTERYVHPIDDTWIPRRGLVGVLWEEHNQNRSRVSTCGRALCWFWKRNTPGKQQHFGRVQLHLPPKSKKHSWNSDNINRERLLKHGDTPEPLNKGSLPYP